jgi:hypothetical protein
MTIPNEDIEAWLAIRKEAAKAINPATALVTWHWGHVLDPYGIFSDEERCIGRIYFARAPLSDVWVSFDDLPKSVVDELWKRHKRRGPNSPSPFDDDDLPFDDYLPGVNQLVTQIMARDKVEPGYAAAVAHACASAAVLCAPVVTATILAGAGRDEG